MMIRKSIVALVMVVLSAAAVFAQENDLQRQLSEMKKLEPMAGRWEGSGWMQQGPKRTTFTGSELVQSKLGGRILLVEGKFVDPDGRVIHETLAVLSSKASKFDFQTHLGTGMSGIHEFRVGQNGYEWGFQTSAGTIRYLISVKDDVWFEVGEFSRDGKTWIKFFEMSLKRANAK